MDELLAPVLDHLDRAEPGEFAGVYLYGSSVSGGLRPDSDIDLLVLTRRSLTTAEREELTRVLLDSSGWSGHAETFPEAAAGRPLELTAAVIGADGGWPEPAVHDYQFGEWLQADILGGAMPEPSDDPDVPILLATAQTAHRVLRGAPLADVVQPVPVSALTEAMLGIIPDILEEIVGDERNTLLAFARIVTTLRTGGEIVPKDVAATAVAATLPSTERALMERARDGYLGIAPDDWTGLGDEVTALSHALARQASELAAATPARD